MSQPANNSQSSAEAGAHVTAQNRYILLAVIMFAAVVAVYLLKTNMEPPKPAETGAMAPSASDMPAADADSSMANVMHQVEHIREILARDSSNFDAWAALGNLFFDADMPGEALAHYRRALALRPGDLNVMTDLATMERAAGRPDSAVAILERIVAADSARPQAWFNLGVIQSFDLKNQRAAVVAWRKYLAISPASEHTEAVRRELERLEKELGM